MGLTVTTYNGGSYDFDGPHANVGDLHKMSGVYLISTILNGYHSVIDIGESHNVHDRVSNHDRGHLWPNYAVDGKLYVSALYCDEPTRMTIETQLRAFHNPPVGDR